MTLVIKPVLTVDIVEFSKRRSGDDQMTALRALIKLLDEAIPEGHNNQKMRLWSPAGDGGSLTFEDIHAAVETAVTLGQYIAQYNKGVKLCDANGQELPRSEKSLEVRIGLHVGPVLKETDFDNRENVWGRGINMSARVASLAKPNQIVASREFIEQAELENHPEYEITNIGRWWAKHDISFSLFNIYKDGGGIPRSEVGGWFDPFQHPLQRAIGTYSAMAEEEVEAGKSAFRVLVLAKRLLDLNPQYERAIQMIQSVSVVTKRFRRPGQQILYDAFFSGLSPSALLYFFQNAQFKDFEAGRVIFEEGSEANSMMMIVLGKVILFQRGERRPDVVLGEGDIIGEMGLFNPEGEKRTATLKASKNTVGLSLDYDFLRPESSRKPSDCEDIRAQIWYHYRIRKSQSLIQTDRLFKNLSDKRRNELWESCEFLPAEHNKPIQLKANEPVRRDVDGFIQLDADDVWNNHWLLVAEGNVIVRTKGGKRVEFTKGEWLGPICVIEEESPYDVVKASPNTHLVRLPWEVIKELLKELKTFRDKCVVEGFNAHLRLGLGMEF